MEISAWIFFAIWAFIGILSLVLAMATLKTIDLPSSVSPAIVFFLKQFLATATCHSSTYSLVFRTKMKIHATTYYVWYSFSIFPMALASISGESLASYTPIYSLFNISVVIFYFLPWSERFVGHNSLYFQSLGFALIPLLNLFWRGDSFMCYLFISLSNYLVVFFNVHFAAIDDEQFALLIHYGSMAVLFIFGGILKEYSPFLVLSVSFFTLLLHAAISGDERFRRWLPAAAIKENQTFSKFKKMMKKKGKVIEFLIGMAGTILFQIFFPSTSLDHVVAFLFLAAAWLANLALLLCPYDFGIFNFLLGNTIVGCTIGRFGLRNSTAWIVCAASLLLYLLRVKLELISVVNRGEEKASAIAWGESQITTVGELLPCSN